MEKNTKKHLVYSSVLEVLFVEVYKDGRILEYEKEISKLLVSNLNIPVALYKKVRQATVSELVVDKDAGTFEAKSFLSGIRSKLERHISAKEINHILKRLATILEYPLQNDDLLQVNQYNPKNLIHPNKSVRSTELNNLLNSEIEGKLLILQNLFKRERDLELRYEIQKALNVTTSLHQTTPVSTNDLVDHQQILQSSNLEEIRKFSIFCAKSNDSTHVSTLIELAAKWNDSHVKAALLTLLPQSHETYHDELDQYFNDADPRVIAKAIEVAEILGKRHYLPYIIDLVHTENNRIRANAIKALHSFGEDGVYEALEEMCDSEYAAYRDSAAYTLLQVDIEGSHLLLEKLINDEVESVRQKAFQKLEHLAGLGDQDAQSLLSNESNLPINIVRSENENNLTHVSTALHSESTTLRMDALPKVIDSLNPEDAISEVYERLKIEREPKVISKGLSSLVDIEGFEKEKIEILSHFLQHSSDHRVRSNAVEALGHHHEVLSPKIFLDLLEEEDNRLLGNAIINLSKYDNYKEDYLSKIIECLTNLSKSENKFHQLTALYCVGVLNIDSLLPVVESLQNSSHLRVLLETKSCVGVLNKKSEIYSEVLKRLDKNITDMTSKLALGQILEIENFIHLKDRIFQEDQGRKLSTKEFEAQEKRTELANKVRIQHDTKSKKIVHKFDPNKDMANFNRRVIAYAFDLVFLFLFAIFVFLIPFVSLIQLLPHGNTIAGALIAWGYYLFFECLDEFDSTPGKMIVGLSVVKGDGSFPSYKQSSQRSLMRYSVYLPCLILGTVLSSPVITELASIGSLVPYMTIVASHNYQGMHDKVANLYVIDVKKRSKKYMMGLGLLVYLPSSVIFVLMVIGAVATQNGAS